MIGPFLVGFMCFIWGFVTGFLVDRKDNEYYS